MELPYQYLTGSRFRQRVRAIVETITAMRENLDKEKRSILNYWVSAPSRSITSRRPRWEIEGLDVNALECPGKKAG